jgi:hypothetical protein
MRMPIRFGNSYFWSIKKAVRSHPYGARPNRIANYVGYRLAGMQGVSSHENRVTRGFRSDLLDLEKFVCYIILLSKEEGYAGGKCGHAGPEVGVRTISLRTLYCLPQAAGHPRYETLFEREEGSP